MEDLLASEPKWSSYAARAQPTKDIMTYWTTKRIGGGPLTEDIQTRNVKAIRAPLGDLLGMTKNFGLYDIIKVNVEADR